MSCTYYMKSGAKYGFFSGLIPSDYLFGVASGARNPAREDLELIGKTIFYTGGAACLMLGPPVGAVTGLGVYGIRKTFEGLKKAPKPVQRKFFFGTGVGIGSLVLFSCGKFKNFD